MLGEPSCDRKRGAGEQRDSGDPVCQAEINYKLGTSKEIPHQADCRLLQQQVKFNKQEKNNCKNTIQTKVNVAWFEQNNLPHAESTAHSTCLSPLRFSPKYRYRYKECLMHVKVT